MTSGVSASATVSLGIMHYGGAALVVWGNVLRSAFPFEKCLPPGGIFTSFSLIIAEPPLGAGKLSFREAVLPLMYRVREDGLQTGTRRQHTPALIQLGVLKTGLALPNWKPIAWGIFGMNEPIITCPHCKAELNSFAASLIEATRKKVVERERAVARRESAIASQRAELATAVELAEQQLTTRLKTEREIAAEEAKKAQLSELESKSQEVAHLQRELQECETKLAEAKNAEAELIRKQGELEYEKRQLDVQIETRVEESLSSAN